MWVIDGDGRLSVTVKSPAYNDRLHAASVMHYSSAKHTFHV